MKGLSHSKVIQGVLSLLMVVTISLSFALTLSGTVHALHTANVLTAATNLDCNGFGAGGTLPAKLRPRCLDFTMDENGQIVRGEDNGHYIGHDEPTAQYTSTAPGSGNNVQWHVTLPQERPLPATQTFENVIAFRFDMALCDNQSDPIGPCTPDSDSNNPRRVLGNAGSAILELQLYPSGNFATSNNCDVTLKGWCAALTIDSLERFPGQAPNPNCAEPVNFSYLQTDGKPLGNPAPGNLNTQIPNAQTFMMGNNDRLVITIKDVPDQPGVTPTTGGVLTRIDDLTTHQSGFLVASAANGFAHTNPVTCAQSPYSFHPEYATAKFGNFVSWAALQANVDFSIETGHFNVCDKVDNATASCVGNEGLPGHQSPGDADDPPCSSAGPGLQLVSGCTDQVAANGDNDFDGTSYQTDWPNGTRHNASSMEVQSPLSAPNGSSNYEHGYPIVQLQTDILGSETGCNVQNGVGCVLPPPGASFYPYFSVGKAGASCVYLFGNNSGHEHASINDFGKLAQYGTPNLSWSGQTDSGGPIANPCSAAHE